MSEVFCYAMHGCDALQSALQRNRRPVLCMKSGYYGSKPASLRPLARVAQDVDCALFVAVGGWLRAILKATCQRQ